MALGRKTGGRKKGSRNRKTIERETKFRNAIVEEVMTTLARIELGRRQIDSGGGELANGGFGPTANGGAAATEPERSGPASDLLSLSQMSSGWRGSANRVMLSPPALAAHGACNHIEAAHPEVWQDHAQLRHVADNRVAALRRPAEHVHTAGARLDQA